MRHHDFYNIRVKRVRWVNGRMVCDLINGNGKLILSGNIDWVQEIAGQRGYEIENPDEANAAVDALSRQWGTY